MSAVEFAEWAEYYAVEPFGEARGDIRAALTSFAVMKAAGSKTARIEHFLPFMNLKSEAKSGKNAARAQIQDAFLKAASKLPKRVITRKKKAA